MRVAEIHADTEAFMNSREFEVERAVEDLVARTSDVAGYRLNNAARQILMSPSCRVRLQLALDALQITYDDLEGKR